MKETPGQVPDGQDMDTVSFDQLHLQVGQVLRLTPQDPDLSGAHYAVRFIGALPGKGLITTLPLVGNKCLWMPTGSTYVLRVLSGTHVYAFSSQVIRARANPYPHVHFQFPPSVQARKVRNALRVSMNLEIQVNGNDGKVVPATLVDLGMNGARIETTIPLAMEDPLLLVLPIQMDEAQSQLALRARVRNQEGLDTPGNGQSRQVGLAFEQMAKEEALLLHYFIDHALAEEGAEKR